MRAVSQGNSIKIDIHLGIAFWLNELWIWICKVDSDYIRNDVQVTCVISCISFWKFTFVDIFQNFICKMVKIPSCFIRFESKESRSGGLMTVNIIRCSFALNKLSTQQRTIIVHVVLCVTPRTFCSVRHLPHAYKFTSCHHRSVA